MSTKQQKNDEEVDLGSLFVIIGKGFNNFFNFIGAIFKGAFHLLILILLFLKLHVKKFILAAFIGGVLGGFLEYKTEDRFGSNLLVQPNFNSARQLYNNVNYYNDLVKQEKKILLASIFDIDTTRASTIKKFEITPIKNQNDIINAYDTFIVSADTLTVQNYAFDEFKSSFTEYDYLIHNIQVEATANDVFSGMEEVIIASVVKNSYFNRLKKLNSEILYRTDSLLKMNLIQVDSLRQVYTKVMLEEAKKESSGTSIDLGGTQKTTKEIELFDTDKKIINDLKQTSKDIAETSEVINIVSNFQTVGYEVKVISKNYIFILAGISIMLTLFCILLLELNTYLTNYKKE